MRLSDRTPRTASTIRTLAASTAALVALVALPNRASAQSAYFYLDRAQISGAPDDGFMVWRPHMGDETRFYGFAALGYTHNPLRDESVTADATTQYRIDDPIRGQFLTYLSMGAEISRHLSLNISLPIQLYKVPGPSDPST